ncbi:hypothetical protein B0I37DRAFT_381992 [Chaetomium sp. MPI-CAGE-AT-0009]|nr:hypothetical protein B0I37DRAFT_381992 [Chaetomium sp. MPI-CAGE-AT-0009]
MHSAFRHRPMRLQILSPFVVGVAGFTTTAHALALVTPAPPLPTTPLAQPRDAVQGPTTCGFLNGDPSQPWVAPKGFDCRINTVNSIWGICPTNVAAETDCRLGAYCFDSGPCSTGCGRETLRNDPQVATRICPEGDGNAEARFCSMAALVDIGLGVSVDYIDCAQRPGKATYFLTATAALPTTLDEPSSPPPQPDRWTAMLTANPSPPSTPAGTLGTNFASGGGDTGSNNNTGAIVGGTLGGLALVLGFVLAVVYLLRNNCVRGPKHATDEGIRHEMAGTAERELKDETGGWGVSELASDSSPGELPTQPTTPVQPERFPV